MTGKCFGIMRLIFFQSLVLLALSCSKQEDVQCSLDFSDAAALSAVPSEGGNFSVTVSSKRVKWKISERQGELSIVESLTPVYAGSEDAVIDVSVTVTIKANGSSSSRESALVVRSLDGSLEAVLPIVQSAPGSPVDPSPVAPDGGVVDIVLDPSQNFQTIEGFGAMNEWGDYSYLSNFDIDRLFGLFEPNIGLNILRIRISPNESNWKNVVSSCKYAYEKYGALILASPWSPPSSMKTNGSVNGKDTAGEGSLKSECYEEYADYLERFAAFMKQQGAPLYAISVQNEPDWSPDYEGCSWTSGQNHEFIRDWGGKITSARLATAESLNMGWYSNYYKPLLDDDAACENFDIVAGHIYGAGIREQKLAQQKGKSVWMTEHLLNDSWSDGTDHWVETMKLMEEIHDCLSVGWNAYVYWWAKRYYGFLGDGEQGTVKGNILPRGYAMAQFSRYIRPGYVRIASESGSSSVLSSAWEGDGRRVVVLINKASSGVEVSLKGLGTSPSAIFTSASSNGSSLSLKSEDDGSVSTTLKASSITTVVSGI